MNTWPLMVLGGTGRLPPGDGRRLAAGTTADEDPCVRPSLFRSRRGIAVREGIGSLIRVRLAGPAPRGSTERPGDAESRLANVSRGRSGSYCDGIVLPTFISRLSFPGR